MNITTFGSWARSLLDAVVLEHDPRSERLRQFARDRLPAWEPQFLTDEVDYVLGRYLPLAREQYLDTRRVGRGSAPRVERPTRERLLLEVIEPFQAWKQERGLADWADLAIHLALNQVDEPYDVVVVDETQDFSANQVRAVVNHLAGDFVCTFVRDTTQRIYPNAFTWAEVGVEFGSQSRRLRHNYRNTRQIAAFARPLVEGTERIEDESLPDFTGCATDGSLPTILRGRYSSQVDWAVDFLRSTAVEAEDSVAFLHPKGWFAELRRRLDEAEIPWDSLTRESEWPEGDVQVGLCTMHSAKGLEFDHVLILGYNAEVVQHGDEPEDALLDGHRRLLAMAAGRARKTVTVGYLPTDAPQLIELLADGTFVAVDV